MTTTNEQNEPLNLVLNEIKTLFSNRLNQSERTTRFYNAIKTARLNFNVIKGNDGILFSREFIINLLDIKRTSKEARSFSVLYRITINDLLNKNLIKIDEQHKPISLDNRSGLYAFIIPIIQ